MRLPVDVRHVEGPAGPPAVFGLFVAAQPQIETTVSKAAHVRVIM
jgi:hypothetical protein